VFDSLRKFLYKKDTQFYCLGLYYKQVIFVRSGFLTVVLLKIQVFWNMMLCIGHEFSMFQRIVVPSSLGVKQSSSLGLLDPEGEDTAVLSNTRNTWPNDSVTSQKRMNPH